MGAQPQNLYLLVHQPGRESSPELGGVRSTKKKQLDISCDHWTRVKVQDEHKSARDAASDRSGLIFGHVSKQIACSG
jgi:hypothetical protein